ncbi:protein-glutamine glutaminase family protein [Bdellovibrionota bacterium FG-1]
MARFITKSPALFLALTVGLFCSCNSHQNAPNLAPNPVRSQFRPPSESWKKAAARNLNQGRQAGSAYDSAVQLDQLQADEIPQVSDEALQAVCAWVRETRFLNSPEQDGAPSGFLRRPSWLYPDDGCWARAALAANRMETRHLPAPKKLFVFGDLELKTDNSPSGKVWWWYHIAPVYRTGSGLESVRVIDPSIDPSEPLTLAVWAQRQSGDPGTLLFASCEKDTYEPGDSCLSPMAIDPDVIAWEEQDFLRLEWDRQIELGRDPLVALGDQPPWSHVQ